MLTRRAFLVAGVSGVIGSACGLRYGTGKSSPSLGAQGSEDDTAHLQLLLDQGGTISLERDRIYRVSGQPGAKAALFIGSDTFLDLAGAILELAPNQRCAMIAHRPGSRVRNIRIANGTIVGNGARQPADFRRDIGITPTLYLMDCDNLELRDLEMRDTYMYAVYAQGNDGVANNLTVTDAIGGGIHLNGARWRIDGIRVRNVSYFEPVNCTGNPFIVSLRDSEIGRVYCENFGFGVKFQDGCENVTVGSIEAVGGSNNNDYLVKIQGKNDSGKNRPNRNIKIGRILSRNGPLSGLYIYHSTDVEIGSYHGEANGRSDNALDIKNGADILIIDSDQIHFGELKAIDYPRHALWLHDQTGLVTAERVVMESRISRENNPVVIRNGRAVLEGIEHVTPKGPLK
jgi:hypothetical protein